MSGRAAWRPLAVSAEGVPKLLVSTKFTETSYTIHLTDLAQIWSESMERKPIISRAINEDTSIDPTDGSDQLQKLVGLIGAAFDPNDAEHGTTGLSLYKDNGDSDDLSIDITCTLPKPLRPLRWPMRLKKCPPSAVATELVLPLIQAHSIRVQEVETLLNIVRDKEAVITKVVDKLEATGTGLEHVFSSLVGRRRVTRSGAEGRVKGLAPFKESEFRANSAKAADGPPDVPSLLEGVFGGQGLQYLDVEAAPMLDTWWKKLGRDKKISLVNRGKETDHTRADDKTPALDTARTADDDDDFQIQATPPGLKSGRKSDHRSKPQPTIDDSTTDDDGDVEEIPDSLPEPAAPSRPPELATAPRSSGKRLGKLGGGKKMSTPPPRSPAQDRRPTADPSGQRNTSDTSSDAEDDGAESPPLSQALVAEPRPTPQRKRGGLGRIGGKVSGSRRSSSPVAASDDTPPQAQRPRRLGVIGKREAATHENEALGPDVKINPGSDEDARGRRAATGKERDLEPKGEQPRETSQERANRIRQEVQREQEKKAAAGPAKKKRKF